MGTEIKETTELIQPNPGKMILYSFGGIITSFGGIVAYYFLQSVWISWLFFYYEVEIGLPYELIYLSLIIYLVWSMINKFILGYLTDKHTKWTRKWGMRFPWILIGMFTSIIIYFFIWIPPIGASQMTIFLWFTIFICLFDLFYSLFVIHFYGTFTTQFRSGKERRIASIFNTIIPPLVLLFVIPIFPIIVTFGDRFSFIFAALITVLIMSVFALISIYGVIESDELKELLTRGYESTERVSFGKTMRIAFRQKNFVVTLVACFLILTAYYLFSASWYYFFRDVLRLSYRDFYFSSGFISIQIFLLVGLVGLLVSIPLWWLVASKYGHAKTFTLGCLLISLCFLPYLWISNYSIAIIWSFILSFALGCFFYMVMTIFADVNDEFAVTARNRKEAALFGIRTSVLPLVIIFGMILLEAIRTATGYNPDYWAAQSPLAIWGIRAQMALIPAILSLVAFFIVFKWYDLDEKKKEQIIAKMREMGL